MSTTLQRHNNIRFRFVVIRRIFVIAGFLYFCRAVTLAATPLPPSYSMLVRNELCTEYVAPENRTVGLYVQRVIDKVRSVIGRRMQKSSLCRFYPVAKAQRAFVATCCLAGIRW